MDKYLGMDIVLNESLIKNDGEGNIRISVGDVLRQLPDDFMFKCSQKEVQAIIDCIHDGIYITDGEGKTLMVNRAEKEYESSYLDEVDVDSFVGKNVAEMVEEGYWDMSICLEVIKSKTSQSYIQRVNGESVLCTGIPYFENGEITRVVATDRNISTLEKLQDTLMDAESRIEKYRAKVAYESKIREVNAEQCIYRSRKMKDIVNSIKKVAGSNVTVLIQGESGCGKELIADMVVSNSERRKAPFIKINCSALPESLIESELFGYEKGAFTGADPNGKIGLFEAAEGGTILLDEIGELPLNMQAKLLRVLQEREVMRIGGSMSVPIDVRVIAATNVDLKKKVEDGAFREDLYYRLNIIPIEVPALRERVSDIEVLVGYFFKEFNKKYHTNITPDREAMEVFEEYKWPGNVRELKNLIERLIVVYDADSIIDKDIARREIYHSSEFKVDEGAGMSLKEQVDYFEKKLLEDALKKTGSGKGAAKLLKLSESAVSKKLKKHAIKSDK